MLLTRFLILTAMIASLDALATYNPASAQGQTDASSVQLGKLLTPGKITKTANGTYRQEQAGNLLVNPSFEHETVATGWTLSSTGGGSPSLTANGTVIVDGAKSARFRCLAGSAGTCSLKQSATHSSFMNQNDAVVRIHAGTEGGTGVVVKLFPLIDGTRVTNGTVINHTAPITRLQEYFISWNMGSTSYGLEIEITMPGSGDVSVYVDKTSAGPEIVKQVSPSIDVQYDAREYNRSTGVTSYTGALTDTDTFAGLLSYNSTTGVWTALKRVKIDMSLSVRQSGATTTVPNILTTASIAGTVSTTPTASGWTTVSFTGVINPGGTIYAANLQGTTDWDRAFITATHLDSSSSITVQNQDTDWAPCTFSTLAWQGLGTVTHELKCRKNGEHLEMTGRVNLGTVAASEVRIPLPLWSGTQLVTKSNLSTFPFLGRAARNIQINNDYSILGVAGQSYLNMSIYNSSGVAPHVAQTGPSLFSTADVIFFENARIPIAGWTTPTTAQANISEMVKSSGTSGTPDVQSVVFGSGANCATACSSGTCTICKRLAGSQISSITFNATSSYNVYGIDGTKYSCSGTGFTSGNYGVIVTETGSSTSSYVRIRTGHLGTNSNIDSATMTCWGTP